MTVIQQPISALFLKRTERGTVELALREYRSTAHIELNQQELHKLYCELGVLLVERPRDANA